MPYFVLFVCFLKGEGVEGGRTITKKGKGIEEWLKDMSLYSAKINSKEHNCFMMLVNTEFCMALTNSVT